MTTIKRVLLSILPIVVAVGIAGFLHSMKPKPEKKDLTPKALLVETQPVIKQDLNYSVESQGTVKPKHQSVIVTEVNGRIIAVADNFVVGGFFAKGDILIRIDPSDYETAVKSAQANLARAEAALQEEKARAKVAEEEWKSFTDGNAPELYLRKPQLARELANVRSAQASLEVAERDLRRTAIRAPFNVMIKQKSAEIGQFVSRGSTLGTVYGTDIAEVRLPLSDSDMGYLQLPKAVGDSEPLPVTLSALIAGKLQRWDAQIVRSEGVVDEKSRVTYAVAQLVDPYGLKATGAHQPLSYGRFVQAQIQGKFATGMTILPRHVLTRDHQVMVVKDLALQLRQINIARMDEEQVYIDNGLQEGELYITSVIPNPINGMKLRLTTEAQTESDASAVPAVDAIAQTDQ